MNQLIECIPNFSEGRDQQIIDKIASTIEAISGVKLLHLDAGKAANRTVMTFVGAPEMVVEAAFQAIKKAKELIDMRTQYGEHPRIGATDVCPLVPVSGITMDETVKYADDLGRRVAKELSIPVYLYEDSQRSVKRKNLAHIRKGEYEGMASKIKLPEWKPDFGKSELSVKSGVTVIGARDFLIAYNINLGTDSVEIAKKIAQEIRESGYVVNGERVPGLMESVKAIGWYIEEYSCAQVSMNITNIVNAPIHIVYETICDLAKKYNITVEGSELIGLIPLKPLKDAGEYFILKQKGENFVSELELLNCAVDTLKLNSIASFTPEERVLEYMLATENN